MRVAGYIVREAQAPEDPMEASIEVPRDLRELGFDFVIIGGIAGYTEFQPIPIDPLTPLERDAEWLDLEARLWAQLDSGKRLSAQSGAR